MDKIPYTELERMVDAARENIAPGSRWRHYKGHEYSVVDIVIIENNNELSVAYSPIEHPGVTFIRPLRAWQELVDWDGSSVHRFTRVD